MATLQSDIKYDGVNQRDLVALLENMRDLTNDVKAELNALRTDVAGIRTKYNAMHASLVVATLTGTHTVPALSATTVTISDLSLMKG